MSTLHNTTNGHRNRSAFTLLELVFVIVVIGILAALAIPRLERDIRQEAADNIVAALRQTKHRALTDNVTDPRDNRWQRAFWRMGIEKCSDDGIFYYIGSDKDYQGDIDNNETIFDVANGKRMMGSNSAPCETQTNNNASPTIFLTKKYGITLSNLTFTNCGNGNGRYIGFDYFGRPHHGFAGNSGSTSPNYNSIITTDCRITVTFPDSSIDNVTIVIERGTGHIFIEGQEDS